MDEQFLNSLSTDIQLIKKDIKFIKEGFESEKEHSARLGRINAAKVDDHEQRIRILEKMMYKGLGAAIILSVLLSAAISYLFK